MYPPVSHIIIVKSVYIDSTHYTSFQAAFSDSYCHSDSGDDHPSLSPTYPLSTPELHIDHYFSQSLSLSLSHTHTHIYTHTHI